MTKQIVMKKAKEIATLACVHSPEILTAVSCVGTVATAYLSGRAALRIDEKLKLAEEIKGEPLDTKEKVVCAWEECILPGAAIGVSIGAAILSHRTSSQRYATLLAAYTAGQKLLGEERGKLAKLIGMDPQKVLPAPSTVLDEVPNFDKMIIDTGKGKTICYDPMTGRYFYSDPEAIRAAQNDVLEQIHGDWSATLNEFYAALGLDSVKLGDDLGWNVNNLIRLRFDSSLLSNGTPILVMDYEVYPEYRL